MGAVGSCLTDSLAVWFGDCRIETKAAVSVVLYDSGFEYSVQKIFFRDWAHCLGCRLEGADYRLLAEYPVARRFGGQRFDFVDNLPAWNFPSEINAMMAAWSWRLAFQRPTYGKPYL